MIEALKIRLFNESLLDATRCQLETFLMLPRRAQEVICAVAEDYRTVFMLSVAPIIDGEEAKRLTPIEATFLVAFRIYSFLREAEVPPDKRGNPDDGSPAEVMIENVWLHPQEEVFLDGKKYVVDFLFDGSNGDFEEHMGHIKVAIECDGHDFHHKTKKQVEYDNERQLALQTAGYDVIRFSGSRIYIDPLGCAEKAYNFILSKIKN